MKSVLNNFANDTDADLAAYVQMYRTRIADRTDGIEEMVRGPIDEAREVRADQRRAETSDCYK
jgi:hypothetical protein